VSQTDPAPGKVRFGPFELDRESGELLKEGLRIKLQDQPLQILCILLEHPGRIVNREELKNRIWPADTFVEFDQGLYSAIRRLRDALGDSAESPRYVETMARRGYRFVAKLEQAPVSQPNSSHRRRNLALVGLAVVALTAALFVLIRSHGRSGRAVDAPIHSLAVLPLVSVSQDPRQDYFADGMTDELITDVAQIAELRVISRTSSLHYKGTHKTLPQIAQELHVDAIVEGTVDREGNRVRIRIQLIRARDDRHLWAHAYERDMQDVLRLQSDAARDIAEHVRLKLLPYATVRAVNPQAYESYLRGRHQLSGATSQADLESSIASFQAALSEDPGSALGYAGLAESYVALSDYYLPPREVLPKAETAARKALEIDERLSEAHDALGWVEFVYGWKWSAAEQHLKRAIELNSNNALAHDHYANLLSSLGHHPESLIESQRARDLDPFSLIIQANRGFYFYMARDFDFAIEEERKALELDPNCYTCRTYLALAYAQEKRFSEALAEVGPVKLPQASPIDVATTGCVLAGAGEQHQAKQLLQDLQQLTAKRFVCPYELATTHLALGDREQALRKLEEAYQVRSICMIWLKVDPRLDPLRSDQRFQDLMHRVGFTP